MLYPLNDTELERAMVTELKKIKVVADLCEDKRTVIQAGGAAGDFAIELSSIFGKVITFEPQEDNYQCLVHNVKNYYNIQYFAKGLYNKKTYGNMVTDQPTNYGAFQFREEAKDCNMMCTTIDSLELPDCGLIYLDIEGSELKALEGGKNTILQCRPVIVIENKGLIPGYGTSIHGCDEVRKEIEEKYNYRYHSRLMRDDIFVPLV